MKKLFTNQELMLLYTILDNMQKGFTFAKNKHYEYLRIMLDNVSGYDGIKEYKISSLKTVVEECAGKTISAIAELQVKAKLAESIDSIDLLTDFISEHKILSLDEDIGHYLKVHKDLVEAINTHQNLSATRFMVYSQLIELQERAYITCKQILSSCKRVIMNELNYRQEHGQRDGKDDNVK